MNKILILAEQFKKTKKLTKIAREFKKENTKIRKLKNELNKSLWLKQ